MGNFFYNLRERITKLSKKQKILLSLTIFLIFVALGFFLSGKKRGREEEFVRKAPPLEQVPQPITTAFINKISQFFRGQKVEVEPLEKITPTPAIEVFAAKKIAETALSYLDQQKRPDGFYHFFAHYQDRCQDPSDRSTCPLGKRNVIEQANMWVVLSRLAYYQNFSQDLNHLSQAEEDAKTLMNFCYQDLKKCRAVLLPFIRLYQETKKEGYQRFIKEVGQLLLQESYGSDVMSLGTQARELILLYGLFSDPRFLDRARQRLVEAGAASKADQSKYGFDDEVCYVTLAQTEIGRATGDQRLLQEAAQFFKANKETQVPAELTMIQPCIEAAFLLGEVLNDKQIKTKGVVLLDQFVLKRWDGPQLGRMYQEGGFFSGEDKTLINITDTAYMIYLLLLEPSRSYSFNLQKKEVNPLGVSSAVFAQADEPGGQECLGQCEDAEEKYKQFACTGGCSSPQPEGDCQCRLYKSYTCTSTCVWGYCANTCCTNYEAICNYEWVCETPSAPTLTPKPTKKPRPTPTPVLRSTVCDCLLLTSDHPSPSWVKKGDLLNFTAEAYVSPSGGDKAPNMVFALYLNDNPDPVANSGEVPAVFDRQMEVSKEGDKHLIDVYKASWSYTVPNTPSAEGLYHLYLDINCGWKETRSQQTHIASSYDQALRKSWFSPTPIPRAPILSPPAPPPSKQGFSFASLLRKVLSIFGVLKSTPEKSRIQALPTPTPEIPFRPPFPTVVRPTDGQSLQLGTFFPIPTLPPSGCTKLYFQVLE